MDSSRHLHINLLDQVVPSHNNYGLWTLPENEKRQFRSIAFWKKIARACEDAMLDSLFIADHLGIATVYDDSTDFAVELGMHVPALDPALVAATMLESTTSLGFGITQSCTYEHPFTVARKFATLDHLSGGRVGWNIVMSYHPNANENYGLDVRSLPSEERYNRAEDFMEVAYKLFEQSWEEGAILEDVENGRYADPSRVHRIDHLGPHYRSAGPALVDPSPQRTPLLFQAGMSDRGRLFAAKHAEVVFVVNQNDEGMHTAIADIRQKAASFGRGADELKIVPMVSVITAETDEEAQAKLERFNGRTNARGYLAHEFAHGFDPFAYPRGMKLGDAMEQAGFPSNDSGAYGHGPDATVGDVIDAAGDLRNERFFVVGDGKTVADALEGWADDFGIDGYNLRNFTHPGTVVDFGRHVVPELQRRGRYRTRYEGSTLRENVFGEGHARISPTHVAASHRRS